MASFEEKLKVFTSHYDELVQNMEKEDGFTKEFMVNHQYSPDGTCSSYQLATTLQHGDSTGVSGWHEMIVGSGQLNADQETTVIARENRYSRSLLGLVVVALGPTAHWFNRYH